MRASLIVPGHGPMTSRSSERSERTSSLTHASPIAIASGWRFIIFLDLFDGPE
jgi:hypothetical protein